MEHEKKDEVRWTAVQGRRTPGGSDPRRQAGRTSCRCYCINSAIIFTGALP